MLALSTVLFVILFLSGTYILADRKVETKEPAKNEVKYRKIISDAAQYASDTVNVMVLGLDDEGVRTDVIILFNYSPENDKLNMLSLERDTRVKYDGRRMKLNAVYAAGGIDGIREEVSEITGITADYYIVFDFKGFRKAIDALGGVTFDVPFNMKYDDPVQNLHINLKKGSQLLDGKKAEQLVRYRKGNKKGSGYIDGDVGRIKMQQEFIKALIEQKASFKYITKIDDILAVLDEHVKTDIGFKEISKYAGGMSDLKNGKVNAYSLPGESSMIDGVWYFILDPEETEKLIRENFISWTAGGEGVS
jgi:LCP family protein required for cell wall assembly